ncbi:MAG: FlgD immunoglobulin-like domain containing protein [bacterium]
MLWFPTRSAQRLPRLPQVRLALLLLTAGAAWAAQTVSLPGPVVNPAAFALLANSRYSVVSGFLPDLPEQVLANTVWAMDRAPRLGERLELYVATPENVYIYEPVERALRLHLPGDRRYNSGSAFEVGVAAELHEDAGSAVQAGLLAATAFREEFGAAACPMSWVADHANATWEPGSEVLMGIVFGRAEVRPPDTVLAVRSTDPELADPVIAGPDSFEIVLMGLRQDTAFAAWELSRETVSQLLWAGAGPTPHRTINNRPGLTIPDGFAGYPHTTGLWLVRRAGVSRYLVRPPVSGVRPPAPASHALEQNSELDRRNDLRAATGVTAPAYFVVTMPDTGDWRSRQEAGVVGFQLLVQARALGLAGRLVGPLERAEQQVVARALELPPGLVPVLVFAAGEALGDAAVVADVPQPGAVEIVRARPVLRRGERIRVEYLLRVPGPVRVEVFDMLGRPVRQLPETRQTAGYHSAEWDGTSADGRRVKPGSYIIGVFGPGAVAQHKLSVL